MRLTLFGKSKAIEAEIDEFLNKISDAGLMFEQSVKHFVERGADEEFRNRSARLTELEKSANDTASQIGRELYAEMLIPDLRADVLSLIQDLDYLIDSYSGVITAFEIEKPDVSLAPEGTGELYRDLVENTVKCVEATVHAARAFFKNISAVDDHVHKISFFENEVDDLSIRLKRSIFESNLPLEQKMHFRYFVDVLDELADDAEDTGEWIAIYTIKRSL